jgi:hypothetical protein
MAIKQKKGRNTIDSSFRQRTILCEWLPKHTK